jgi:replication factor C subunit 3/5
LSIFITDLLLTGIKTLTFKLLAKTDDALKPEVVKWSAFYEHRIKLGSVSS